jgi:hypothetical protein
VKHFFNPEMRVFNALTAPVDTAIVDEFVPLLSGDLDPAMLDDYRTRPKWNSDLRWVSARNPEMFGRFEDAFRRLGVAERVEPYVAIDKEVRLFACVLHMRSRCDDTYFHSDWQGLNNDAFTLLTPITDNAAGFGLLYKQYDETIVEYEYKRGEAIIFGDLFCHSTKPGRSDEPVALLGFQFGSDRMEVWDRVLASVKNTTQLFRMPNGEFHHRVREVGSS